MWQVGSADLWVREALLFAAEQLTDEEGVAEAVLVEVSVTIYNNIRVEC